MCILWLSGAITGLAGLSTVSLLMTCVATNSNVMHPTRRDTIARALAERSALLGPCSYQVGQESHLAPYMVANAAQVLLLRFRFVFVFCSPHGRIGESDLTCQLRRFKVWLFPYPCLWHATPPNAKDDHKYDWQLSIEALVNICTLMCASPRSVVWEECADRFTVVHSPDGLCEDVRDV
jgi:hypothetical protein